MARTVEAVIDRDGKIRLLEPVPPGSRRRALVIIFDEPSVSDETAILSEKALQDWNRPEEDAAWSHLQPGK
ncbi:MAG TPA: hypothetical protein VGQ81_03195 [Acidobacteriota bacterium]|nr:hypothetical protein [Acidobacteriota bacterium]